jgi:hypothetical protein
MFSANFRGRGPNKPASSPRSKKSINVIDVPVACVILVSTGKSFGDRPLIISTQAFEAFRETHTEFVPKKLTPLVVVLVITN